MNNFDVMAKQLKALINNVDEMRRRLDEFELYLQYTAPKKGHTVEQVHMTFKEIFRDR